VKRVVADYVEYTGRTDSVRAMGGPVLVQRYNLYSAAAITGDAAVGTSTGAAVPLLAQIAGRDLPLRWRSSGPN
jgi:hypothetical protein